MFWWRLGSIGAALCTAAGCVFHLWMKTEERTTEACVQRQQKWYATCLEFTEKHVMSHLFNLERCKTCYRWQAEVLTGTAIFSSKSWQGGDSGQFAFVVKCLISLFGYWCTTFVMLLHGPNILAKLCRLKIDVVQRLNLDWVWKAQTNVSAWAEFHYWSRHNHYFLIIYYLNDTYVFIHILKCINHSSIWHEFRIVLCDKSNKWKSPSVQDTNS